MTKIEFRSGNLTPEEQTIVNAGFARHAIDHAAPPLEKTSINWTVYDEQNLIGVLTAEILWDWMYIDELWINENFRGQGFGKTLMQQAEDYAISQQLVGLWLWTHSWQAPDFYQQIGFQPFAHFEDFPRGHERIGFRKRLSERNTADVQG